MIKPLNKEQSKQQRDWFKALIDSGDNDLDLVGQQLPWLNQLRDKARHDIATLPLIQRKQETWRYSHSERLFKQTFSPLKNTIAPSFRPNLETEIALSTDNFRLVFVNGQFAPSLSSALPDNNELAPGIILGSLHDVLQSHPELVMQCFEQIDPHNNHLFTELNTALMNYGVFIYLEAYADLQQTIELVYLSSPGDKNGIQANANIANMRNIIVLQDYSRLNLIEQFSGEKSFHYFNNNLSDVVLKPGASIKHSILQDESRSAFHLSSLFLSLDKGSIYQGQLLSMGSSWSRVEYKANFKGASATCDIKGLYTVASQQLSHIHLDIKHTVPGCISRETFKGILYGEGRAVFDGHVLVDKQSQHSDASMKNDNLLLTDNAEVDTKPHLEIYADDVKCSHGTTVGQLDEEQLFYLRSRGIEQQQAKKILCMGFASEIIDAINEPLFQKQVKDTLAERLNDAVSTHAEEKNL